MKSSIQQLPNTLEMLKDLERFNDIMIKHHIASSFPILCFESSLFVYVYIKKKDKNCNINMKFGIIDLSKNQDNTNTLRHCWLEYDDMIIDYTIIQIVFGIPMSLYNLAKMLAKQNIDISQVPYIYDKKDTYENSINFNFSEPIHRFIKNTINSSNISSIIDIIIAYENFLNTELSFIWSGNYFSITGLQKNYDLLINKQ